MFFAKKNRFLCASIDAVVLSPSAPAPFAATATAPLALSAPLAASRSVVASPFALGLYL